MKKFAVLFSLICCAGFLRAEPGAELSVVKVLTLEEALRMAELNNPTLLSSLEDIAIAQQRLKMARHLRYPQLGFDASAVAFERERDFVITEDFGGVPVTSNDRSRLLLGRGTLEQAIYTGGRNKNAIVLSRTSLEQAEIERSKIQRQIARDVKMRFTDYLLAAEKQEALRGLWSLLQTLKSQASEGAAGTLLWEDENLDLALEAQEAEPRGLSAARTELLRAIGMDLYSEIKVSGDLKTQEVKKIPSLTTALSWARELRPEYRSQALSSEMDATQVAIALAGRNPIVSLAGMYDFVGRSFPLRSENWAWMVRMHLPMSWDSWTNIRERRAQRRKGQVLRVDIEDQIASEVRLAHGRMNFALSRVEAQKKRALRWKELFSQAFRSAKSGVERMELFRRRRKAELDYLEARAEAARAAHELEHAIGRALEQ